MQIKYLTATSAAIALLAIPGLALANSGGNHPTGDNNPGSAHKPASTPTGSGNQGTSDPPGPHASLPAKAKAYGVYCRGQSKKHVAGTAGTPFSKCVTDMAKLATGSAHNPSSACKNESKKHVAGEKGTPFSRCVSGAAKLLKNQSGSDTGDTSSS
jgi:hypothetical protein